MAEAARYEARAAPSVGIVCEVVRVSLVVVSKDEPSLADTLDAVEKLMGDPLDEVVVVDASQGRLDWIRAAHPFVAWYDYEQPEGVKVTIAHQRNIGVTRALGDVVVFVDSGCIPQSNWLDRLLAPIVDEGESITCGPAKAQGRTVYSGDHWWGHTAEQYVPAAPTINLAFRREVFDAVDGFDESFAAGEDIDFTWRLCDHGYRLRWVADAVVEHEWGDARRQLRRSFAYGVGWARLFRKHPQRLRAAPRECPVAIVYPIFLIGLPLSLKYRAYPLLLLLPLWRARRESAPLLVLLDHLAVWGRCPYRGGRAFSVNPPIRVLVTPRGREPLPTAPLRCGHRGGGGGLLRRGPHPVIHLQCAGRPIPPGLSAAPWLPDTSHPLGLQVLVAVGPRAAGSSSRVCSGGSGSTSGWHVCSVTASCGRRTTCCRTRRSF